MLDLDKLIADVESADGPSFVMDNLIADAIWFANWGRKRPRDIRAPSYTAMIDDALTIVPQGLVWHVTSDLGGYATVESGDDRIGDFFSHAATPALALVAAAPRARASEVAHD